jgi:hypothetical protein
MPSASNRARPRYLRFLIAIALFIGSFMVVKPIWHAFALEGNARYPVFLIPATAMLLFIREVRSHALQSGRINPAVDRYLKRLAGFMLAYFALLLVAHHVEDNVSISIVGRWIVSILPALPLLGSIWTIGRYLTEEQDEYVRMLAVRSSLFATGITLAIATVWGFLEQANLVAHFPLSYIFAIWCAGLGLGQMTQKACGK